MTHALHNLCASNITLPPGTSRLLSLGLNFCIKAPYPNINFKAMIDQFTHDVRNLHFWLNKEDDGNQRMYIPELYIKSEEWDPPTASAEIEAAIKRFARALRREHQAYNNQWSRPNLTQQQRHLLMSLKNHPILIILASDKNLGPVIMERAVYIQRCLDDFLAKPTQYQRLNKQQVGSTSAHISYRYARFHGSTHSGSIPDEIQTYLYKNQQKHGDTVARFRASPKVHKNPWALRPVIAKCGTTIEGLSKWLDYELQKLRTNIPTYIKNSNEYHQKITSRKWPAGTLLFTADATAMYDNIDIDHGINSVKLWLDDLRDELPTDFPPTDVIIDALDLVMRNNVARFGDCYFKQMCGTAMGTSVAVIYAGLYYAWHEKIKLLPTYNRFILDLSRFVDDMCGLWLGSYSDFLDFQRDMNDYGKLKWTTEQPSNKVIFLDLEIMISNDGVISTKTYQKPQNLYLYIPPHSAHQKRMMAGIVYGEMKRYHWQCTDRQDYVEIVGKFFKRCRNRGWELKHLKRIFLEAEHKLSNPKPLPTSIDDPQDLVEQLDNDPNTRDRLFLKVPFHPNYIPRHRIREIYRQECEDELREHVGIERFTVAYSRPPNIGDILTRSSLYEVRGEEVSTFL